MGMANDMKRLSEEIVASYKQRASEFQQRIKDNASLVEEVQKTLDGFRNDQREMADTLKANAATLRSNLAQGQKERIASFQQMMSGINDSILEIQGEVDSIKVATAGMLKDFVISHGEMTSKLHKDLEMDRLDRMHWNANRLKEFDKLMRNINKEIVRTHKEVEDIFKQTDKLLKSFSEEHDVMSVKQRAELKVNLSERVAYTQKLLLQFDRRLEEMGMENQKMAKALKLELIKSRQELTKSEEQRLTEFNHSFAAIQQRVKEIQRYVNVFVEEFSKDRKQAAATWHKLEELIARLGDFPEPAHKGEVHKTKSNADHLKEDKRGGESLTKPDAGAADEMTGTALLSDKQDTPEAPKELTLEERILNYINTHKKGVRVSEMEKPFGETRMRLGFITKKLLDDGKILKIENAYYPLN